MTGKTAKSRLKALGDQLVEILPEEVAVFVFLQYSDSMPLTQLWRNEESRVGLAGDGKRLLGVCTKRQRSILVHDAEKDMLLKGIKVRTFSSALCVPVLDDEGSFLGTLLALSQSTSTFEKKDRYALERSARDVAPLLKQLRSLPERDESSDSTNVPILLSRGTLTIFAVGLLFLGMWFGAPDSKPKKVVTVKPVQETRNVATEEGEDFLKILREADYQGAWDNLSDELQQAWPQQDFERALRNWSETEDSTKILQSRRISKVQRHLTEARVTLLESDIDGDKGAWDWKFRERDGRWVLISMSGPVISPSLER